jgi:hypothetical protein
VASNKAILLLLLWRSFWRPTVPLVPSAAFARAYRTTTDTPLGQKNYQKWCLGLGSVDLCNFSPFRRCMRTTLLPKQQIRRSESKSEEITAIQASMRVQKDLPVCKCASCAPTRRHGVARAGCIPRIYI